MPDDDRPLHPEQVERLAQQRRLRRGRPDPAARPLAVAEAGPIEHDNAVIGGERVDDAAGRHLVGHRPDPVQQHDRRLAAVLRGATVEIVQAHAVHRDEISLRRVAAFGAFGQRVIHRRRGGQRQHDRRAAAPEPARKPLAQRLPALSCWP